MWDLRSADVAMGPRGSVSWLGTDPRGAYVACRLSGLAGSAHGHSGPRVLHERHECHRPVRVTQT